MKLARKFKKIITLTGFSQFLSTLNKKEKVIFFLFVFLSVFSITFLYNSFYMKNSEIRIVKEGVYIEGLIGSPRYINPIYAQADDVDRDLTELIYSGLMKYNEKGEIIPDLAERYEIIEEGKIFEFYLKDNLLWSDRNPLTVDDIIFTIKSIQNPSLKSPIRASWLGVKTEKISTNGIRFELNNPSAVFLENCTLKIMPEHIWKDVSEQNFHLSTHNLNPVGSGPYKTEEITRNKNGEIKSIDLVTNPCYQDNLPYIPRIIFVFFNNEEELISAFNSGQIDGLSLSSPENRNLLEKDYFSEYHLLLPRYFAVFFNQNIDTEIRQALNYATDKDEIIDKILSGQGIKIDSPILPKIYDWLDNPSMFYEFDPEKAKEILNRAGFSKPEDGTILEKTIKKEPSFSFTSDLRTGSQGSEVQELQRCLTSLSSDIYPEEEISGYFGEKTKAAVIRFQEKYKEEILLPHDLSSGNGLVLKSTRDKLNQLCAPSVEEKTVLSFTLTTFDSDPSKPLLEKTALILKEQWEKIGVEIKINTVKERSIFLEEIVRARDYEMILFGNALGFSPDPFPFWHSSQVKDPGLNLSGYENEKADDLLKTARQSLDKDKRKKALEKFQDILIEDSPAVFLYSPDYLYLISNKIKNFSGEFVIDPSKRFSGIEKWYIETKRVWKWKK
jgi:ABC-type transport system substrate-binding protein